MTEAVTIIIPGDIKGKARPRFSPKSGVAFTPKPTRTREGIIASLAMDAMHLATPFTGPVEMTLTAYFDVPASYSKKRRAACLCGDELPTKKPDLDNVVKMVWDALNKIVYADDSQIVRVTARKQYAEVAKTIVTVTPIHGRI